MHSGGAALASLLHKLPCRPTDMSAAGLTQTVCCLNAQPARGLTLVLLASPCGHQTNRLLFSASNPNHSQVGMGSSRTEMSAGTMGAAGKMEHAPPGASSGCGAVALCCAAHWASAARQLPALLAHG